jgi:ADP-L-glycero-D-manno-heptose 6-epimerase
MRSFLVTGGAGFIGSNIVAGIINAFPDAYVAVVDYLGHDDKWRNISGSYPDEVLAPNEMFFWLQQHEQDLDAIIHMGAISSTTVTDGDAMLEANIGLSKVLYMWCAQHDKRFIYASSAATYGAGEYGFYDSDDVAYLRQLQPLNTYAWSKTAFDYFVMRSIQHEADHPLQWAGLKFFNVYGPNEYHKADQQSVIAKIYPAVRDGEPVKLFKSYHPEYVDGGQLRDFIYVKDCVNVVIWFLQNPRVASGLYNVGTGQARSFVDLARAVYAAAGAAEQIDYIDMPEALRPRYQYFTEADVSKLRNSGYDAPFTALEEGVREYVQHYLSQENKYLS